MTPGDNGTSDISGKLATLPIEHVGKPSVCRLCGCTSDSVSPLLDGDDDDDNAALLLRYGQCRPWGRHRRAWRIARASWKQLLAVPSGMPRA